MNIGAFWAGVVGMWANVPVTEIVAAQAVIWIVFAVADIAGQVWRATRR